MARFYKNITLLLLALIFSTTFFSQYEITKPIIPITSGNSVKFSAQNLTTLKDFIDQIKNSKADAIVGVYVSNTLALRVVQQPMNDPGYVSNMQGVLTQFRQANENKVIGLLAHNYGAGSLFTQLRAEDTVVIIFGDGSTRSYSIQTIDQYQALDPKNPQSDFIDLETHAKLSAQDIFQKYYTGSDHVVFQTCILKGDQDAWGRLFISAQPLP